MNYETETEYRKLRWKGISLLRVGTILNLTRSELINLETSNHTFLVTQFLTTNSSAHLSSVRKIRKALREVDLLRAAKANEDDSHKRLMDAEQRLVSLMKLEMEFMRDLDRAMRHLPFARAISNLTFRSNVRLFRILARVEKADTLLFFDLCLHMGLGLVESKLDPPQPEKEEHTEDANHEKCPWGENHTIAELLNDHPVKDVLGWLLKQAGKK